MTEYQFKNIPLNPSIAAGLILEHLSRQPSPTRRSDLSRIIPDKHVSLGGIVVGDASKRVKVALARLVDDGKIFNPSIGWYTFNGTNPHSFAVDDTELSTSESALEIEAELITSETVLGQGSELVYVYFSISERKLAKFENRNWWPCKVGFTTGNLTTRILSQGPQTSMARLPTVGLTIKTDDGRALERILHYALEEAGASIEDALGSEWFNTSPERISNWYDQHLIAVGLLCRN